MIENAYQKAAELLIHSTYTACFTGAGISVESGIPPFRGADGLWSKYDPGFLDLDYFYANADRSWKVIKEIFYDFFGQAKPNAAHRILGKMEKEGLITEIITQNIDNLHQEGGSQTVHEFHGNSQRLSCTKCKSNYTPNNTLLQTLPPCCECGGLLKPDFIFFGEMIPQDALQAAYHAAENAEVFIVIGSTGEVYPASQIPVLAKQNGAKIIEVNTGESLFTDSITDILLKGKATEVMDKLYSVIQQQKQN
ncbi:MAG: NAD-dependent protein deacylase [Bacteroidota bacterium]